MKKPSFLLIFSLFLCIGCAALSGGQGPALKRPPTKAGPLPERTYLPVGASGLCQIDTTANSVSSCQDGVKMTLRILGPEEAKERIKGKDIFSENSFVPVSVNIENNSDSKIRLPFSETVFICAAEQLEVLSYRAAILLAIRGTAEYAQRAAEPYLRAGLDPNLARQEVANQSYQAIYQESGLTQYEWIDEKPTLTVFPTVRMSKLLLWDAERLRQKFEEQRRIRVIVPDVVLKFDLTGKPSVTKDFWFDFQVQDKDVFSR